MTAGLKSKARFLTLILRHKPEEVDITLDYEGGWASVPDILKAFELTQVELDLIVDSDNKNRFGYNSTKTKIRANQGHSVDIDLNIAPVTPPEALYHGTVEKYIQWIKTEGLVKKTRNHVHLSENIDTATQVASRRTTENVILKIDAKKMYEDGFKFYLSENGVWLVDNVPPQYISF